MKEEKLNIENIKECILKRKIIWTRHCLSRINQRNILISDIKTSIYRGEIIEYYYNDYPYPSCLIVGKDLYNNVIHTVCGINNNIVYVITAYYPDRNEWEDNMKKRRKNNEMF